MEDILSPAREIDNLLNSHIFEDELALTFTQPEPPKKRLTSEPPELPNDEFIPEESDDEPESTAERGDKPPTPQRTEVITREVLRVPCRYCGTLTDPIQNPKYPSCPSCGGRPI